MDAHRPYVDAWRERFRQERQALARAETDALSRARACATCLGERFGARRVYLFGSLTRGSGLRAESDIDLAVSGLAPDRYFEALDALVGLAGREVHLVDLEVAPPAMAAHIAREGVLLHGRAEVPAAQG